MSLELAGKEILEQVKGYAFEYLDNASERRVFPDTGSLLKLDQFDGGLPASTGSAREVLEQLNQYGAGATVSQIAGRYFGFVNGGVLPVALAARWLTDVWDQNTALHVISPLASKLEAVCEGWLRELLGLPDDVVAGYVSGSSLAIFCGLAAGRYRVCANQGWDIGRKGFYGAPRIRLVAGRQAHGTVIKAVALLGLGIDNIEWVDTDDQGRILASDLPALDDRTILVLQAGNVNSGAFDDFESTVAKARAANAWVHIDGAFGLWAAASARLSHLTKGIADANSFSVDGHKTLNTPYDNGIVLCNDERALTRALHAAGSYIVRSEHRDGMFYTPEMSRRARVVELWAALSYLGKAGVDELVHGLHLRAVQFADELQLEGFSILNDVVFNQVLVACDSDDLTNHVMELIQQSGECWVGGSNWQGRTVIRVSVCSWATTAQDVTRSVSAFIAARNQAMNTGAENQN